MSAAVGKNDDNGNTATAAAAEGAAPGKDNEVEKEKEEQEDDEPEEACLKLVVIGDPNAGKSAICTRFTQHQFSQRYQPTQGVDFFSRRIQLPGGITVLLQVWDVAGHSLASTSMLSTYMYGAHACLFVYDVTSTQTFENLLSDWLPLVRRLIGQPEKPVYMALLGNKTDMEHRRMVRVEKHSKAAEQHALGSHYVSAKTGDSVDFTFRAVAAELLGVKLSRAEREKNITVVSAQIPSTDSSHHHHSHHGVPPPPSPKPPTLTNSQQQIAASGIIAEKRTDSTHSTGPIATNKNSGACAIQ